MPVLRDYDHCSYFKYDAGKLLVGAFEPNARPWGMMRHSRGFRLWRDRRRLQPLRTGAARCDAARAGARAGRHSEVLLRPGKLHARCALPPRRVHRTGQLLRRRRVSTPSDCNPPAASARSSPNGFATGIRRWICGKSTCGAICRSRSTANICGRACRRVSVCLYATHWPFRQYETARGVRKSALHDRLAAAGACFGEAFGWERANWYAPAGVRADYHYSYGRQNWFEHSAHEHRAVRNAVGIFRSILVRQIPARRRRRRRACSIESAPMTWTWPRERSSTPNG